jgi:aryl-alcohol dehydrogenase-like predicted oxidoreductase
MDTRRLGTSATEVSVIGLGCNNFGMKLDRDDSTAVVRAALDAGITHFDTAEMYGGGKSEEFLGAALGTRRDDAVIATKFLPRAKDDPYEPGALERRIREGIETSLRRLGTDRIDLYYQHYPDADAPLDEVLGTMQSLVDEGKVVALGSSNVDADLVRAMGPRVSATQIEWNLLSRDVEASVVPAARETGVSVVPYFPLASGLLTGKYRRGEAFPAGSRLDTMPYFASVATDENLERVERLIAFAEAQGHTILELAVAWLLANDAVASVICGATSPEQVRTNAAAAEWTLGPDDLAEVERRLDLGAA